MWESDLTDKMKRSFFQAAVVSILLYECTTWTLTKRLEKKLDGNYSRMMQPILNKSWRQHPTSHQLYGHLPPITKTIQVRRTRHAGHCWRSKDEIISDVFLWAPAYGRAKAGRPARTYIQQICEDTGCSPEGQPEAVNDGAKWRERVRDIRVATRHDDDDGDINFRGVFNSNSIIVGEQWWSYLSYSWAESGVHAFLKGINQKMNEIEWLVSMLNYFKATIPVIVSTIFKLISTYALSLILNNHYL